MQKDNRLKQWIQKKLLEFGIHNLYYFSHLKNFESILKNGILSKNEILRINIGHKSFAEESVQNRRDPKIINLTGEISANLHDLVPLYLTSKTPTLSARREMQNDIFFAVIQSRLLFDDDIEYAFTDGNAASMDTKFYYSLNKLSEIPWSVIKAPYWNDFADGKRKRNAEFLIYPKISVERIDKILINNEQSKKYIDEVINRLKMNIKTECQPAYFF